MRKPVIVGNWKMNKTVTEAKELLEAIKNADLDSEVEAGVCVPAIDLCAASKILDGTDIKFGGQICTLKNQVHLQEKYLH